MYYEKCRTALERAFHKPCMFCGSSIGFEEYIFSKTKAIRSKHGNVPSRILYAHVKCYLEDNESIKKSNQK